MSRKSLLSICCVLPLALFCMSDTSFAQCEAGSAAAAPAAGGAPNVGGGNLLGLLRLNQLATGQTPFQQQQQRLFFMQRQRMMQIQQQEMARQRAQAKAEKEAAEQEAAEEEQTKPEKKVAKAPADDGLTADQRLRRSLLRLERQNGLATRTSRSR